MITRNGWLEACTRRLVKFHGINEVEAESIAAEYRGNVDAGSPEGLNLSQDPVKAADYYSSGELDDE